MQKTIIFLFALIFCAKAASFKTHWFIQLDDSFLVADGVIIDQEDLSEISLEMEDALTQEDFEAILESEIEILLEEQTEDEQETLEVVEEQNEDEIQVVDSDIDDLGS